MAALVRFHCIIIMRVTLPDEDVTSGKIKAIIDHGLYKFQQVYSLCDMLGIVGHSCPLKKGLLTFKATWNDPNYNPYVSQPLILILYAHLNIDYYLGAQLQGTYKVHAEITDQNGERLFCVDATVPM